MQKIEFRKANEHDAEFTYEWRNHELTRQYSHNKDAINKENHVSWFKNAVKTETRCLLIAESKDNYRKPLGVLRYDLGANDSEALVSIYLDPSLHGKGIGTLILIEGSDYIRQKFPTIEKLIGEIYPNNIPSIKAFEKAGYKNNKGIEYHYELHSKERKKTGYKDRNGKTIYEGDVLKWGAHQGKVYFDKVLNRWAFGEDKIDLWAPCYNDAIVIDE